MYLVRRESRLWEDWEDREVSMAGQEEDPQIPAVSFLQALMGMDQAVEAAVRRHKARVIQRGEEDLRIPVFQEHLLIPAGSAAPVDQSMLFQLWFL
jgi:hypothetical protein